MRGGILVIDPTTADSGPPAAEIIQPAEAGRTGTGRIHMRIGTRGSSRVSRVAGRC